MTTLRENLLDRIIRIYGFEHPITIDIAKMCESYPQGEQWDKCLTVLVECHEANPYCEDDE
jgi:hypothetical protein